MKVCKDCAEYIVSRVCLDFQLSGFQFFNSVKQ